MNEEIQQDFDEDEVLQLVEQALRDKGGNAFRVSSKIPLSFGDSALLEKLDSVLTPYLNKADVQMVLHELRSSQLDDFEKEQTLEQLHIVTKNCRKCPETQPGATLPFWNVTDPDVVFVSEVPMSDPNSLDYFTRTASEAGFTSSRICMSFVNRCSKKSRVKHTMEEIENCIPYLLNEIQTLKPKLIVTMGLVATCAILPAKLHMNEERGKIIWLGPWPVLPTYSPAYVLRGSGNLPSLFEQDFGRAYNFVYGEK
jgi:DNA polymerase